MVSQIIVPENILEEIISDGEREAKKGKEATGMLLGLLDQETNSISVSKRYALVSKKGDGSLYDEFRIILSFPWIIGFGLRANSYKKRVIENGGNLGIVAYHSHPYGSWSNADLNTSIGDFIAQVLYRVDKRQFEAINKNKAYIPVIKSS